MTPEKGYRVLEEWDLKELNTLLLPIIPLKPVTAELIEKIDNKNQLKQMLGENEVGTCCDCIITWKNVSQERLDSKTLKAEHPTLYKKYANKTSYRRFSIRKAV